MARKSSSKSEGNAQPCVIQFVNNYSEGIACFWVDYNGNEVQYHSLKPGHAVPQPQTSDLEESAVSAVLNSLAAVVPAETFTTHPWRVRTCSGRLMGQYCGASAQVVVEADGSLATGPLEDVGTVNPDWGQYRKRAEALGIAIMAYDCVQSDAVDVACHIVTCMLRHTPRAIVERLAKAHTQVAIIGRDQVTTDIPEHRFLKMSKGGRDLDATARGLGGSVEVPVTSCGEENLTMVEDSRYPMENILIHEFGHTVMNIGIPAEERQSICDAYKAARQKGLYNKEIYMMENADEYWAEGTQSWFDATIRVDVNDGHNTREKLKAHDPKLASLLQKAFGDGPWRYVHDCRFPLSHNTNTASNSGSDVAAVPDADTHIATTATQPPALPEMDRDRLVSTVHGSNGGFGEWLRSVATPAVLKMVTCGCTVNDCLCSPRAAQHQAVLAKQL